ncbi:hypothetical protein ABEX44_25660 [Priestia megaterium]
MQNREDKGLDATANPTTTGVTTHKQCNSRVRGAMAQDTWQVKAKTMNELPSRIDER